MDELERIKELALKDLESLRDLAVLEAKRVQHLGRSSALSRYLRTLKDRSEDERREFGQIANKLRSELEERYAVARDSLMDTAEEMTARLDVTAPGRQVRRGHLHPLTRAHTSTMQVRFMQAHQPPLRIVVPGRVYRNEATDATHEFQFHQVEGLMVARKGEHAPSLANLQGVMEYFFRRYFDDPSLHVRFNASYFPFVEPGVEVYIKGTRGKLAGRWLEVAGAGMVHQNVFENAGDARGEMQGFAFGAALERLVMLKHSIDDIRLFQGGGLRFMSE